MRWRNYMKFPAMAAAFAGLCGYVLLFVNPAGSQSTFTGPIATSVVGLQTTAAQQIIGANPSRRLIQICNVSLNTTAWISPLPMVATTNGQQGLTLATSGVAQGGSIPLGPFATNATIPTNCYQTPILPMAGGGVGAAWSGITQGTTPASAQANLAIWEY